MTPSDLEERIRQVENKQAVLIEQMNEARHQITVFGALPVQFAELANSVLNLKDDIQELKSDFEKSIRAITDSLERRDANATSERRSVRTALIGLTGVILAALIAAAATIYAAHGGT